MQALVVFVALVCQTLAYADVDWSKIKPIAVNFPVVTPANDTLSPDSRVVGGSEATPNSHPHQVAVIIDGSGFCGGSLISRRWVLSAAHCTISASYVEIVLGAHRIQQNEATQVVVTSRDIINHSGYLSILIRNDVSLIRLPQDVVLNNQIQTVRLAAANSANFAGQNAILSGWGRFSDDLNIISPTLQQVTLPIITNEQCATVFGSLLIATSTICTSGAGRRGACNGDSGGPLVVGGVQVGIVSFGSRSGCEAGDPTAFARVSSFADWIQQNTGIRS